MRGQISRIRVASIQTDPFPLMSPKKDDRLSENLPCSRSKSSTNHMAMLNFQMAGSYLFCVHHFFGPKNRAHENSTHHFTPNKVAVLGTHFWKQNASLAPMKEADDLDLAKYEVRKNDPKMGLRLTPEVNRKDSRMISLSLSIYICMYIYICICICVYIYVGWGGQQI